ncbi:Mbov_0401 family ICE element transposase-like protein [Spiroplasma poulsonii]|uniref:Mbov_0401 family ICE element transposase-like protein n=1 Tax=Spiroplasma poulsonii TaxID=2138 RepID=UPI002B26DE1F|nr:UPF0236 family protein [Spiroplasma poulsonii]
MKRDEEIFLSDETRKLGFKPKGFKKRCFITLLGDIQIKIRCYKFWDASAYNNKTKNYGKWRFKCLLLEDLKFEKYQKITHDLKELILINVADGKRIKDINDIIPVKSLSYSSIARLINKLDLNLENASNNFSNKTSSKYIYIVLDDTFLSLKEKNKKKKFRIRTAFFHQGHMPEDERVGNSILLNKRAYCKLLRTATNINTLEYSEELFKEMSKYYNITPDTQFIVCGDGADWIKNTSHFLNAKYVLDKFHAIRKIGTVFNLKNKYDKLQFKICKGLFNNGEYTKLITHLEYFKNKPNLITKQNNLLNVIKYLKKRKDGIIAYKHDWCSSVCAEALISHTIKAQLGHGNKIYSYDSFRNILALRVAKINGLNLVKEMFNEQLENKDISLENIKMAKWNNNANNSLDFLRYPFLLKYYYKI